jgi:catechol 2,3-dioxygenase-like lactoylglutathione lyase family enzyme
MTEEIAVPVEFRRTIPILRIFNLEKAKEFYCDFMGFSVDWEHRFGKDFPVYLQVSRGDLMLHLSEHHGDRTPGTIIFVEMTGIESFRRELKSRKYKFLRPGIEVAPWKAKVMDVIDPFGSRIRFSEALQPSRKTTAGTKRSRA